MATEKRRLLNHEERKRLEELERKARTAFAKLLQHSGVMIHYGMFAWAINEGPSKRDFLDSASPHTNNQLVAVEFGYIETATMESLERISKHVLLKRRACILASYPSYNYLMPFRGTEIEGHGCFFMAEIVDEDFEPGKIMVGIYDFYTRTGAFDFI